MLNVPVAAWITTLKAYERHISAVAVAGGFAFDSYAYHRVDHPVTQTLLVAYMAVAAVAIALLHWLEARQDWQSQFVVRLRGLIPALIQFVFGSLWSAFLVFYARSGTVAGSWPFLILLAVIFIGNEVFKRYHARLVFTATLLVFALISYAVFMMPVFTHTIGQVTFVLSGIAAMALFAGFVWLLGKIGALGPMRWQMAAAGTGVFVALNVLYFLNVLPPLPLALQDSGVYQSICSVSPSAKRAVRCIGRERDATLVRSDRLYYRAVEEQQSWTTWLGLPRRVHVNAGEPVVVFGAVFAPVNLNTKAYVVWQYYDKKRGEWRTMQRVVSSMRGGRDKGYRGYSYKTSPSPGDWRVDYRLEDGRLIGRIRFTVEEGAGGPAQIVTL